MIAKRAFEVVLALACAAACGAAGGCVSAARCPVPPDSPLPHELNKVSLPAYVIEPPDILALDAISVVPKPPYRIAPVDALLIQATNTLPDQPISGVFGVEPEGTVNLGAAYGSVTVAGLTIQEAREAIEKQLRQFLKEPKVAVALVQSHGMEQIRGEHLVNLDGTVNLGVYGTVRVAGLTIAEAKAAIDRHLTQYLVNPDISLIVTGFNSKVFYVIFDGAGHGQQIFRLPITGSETVLDALAQLSGLPPQASLDKVWVARPAPGEHGCDQILPVDWKAISNCGSTATNYQLLPGDRIVVRADSLITLDNELAKITAPLERLFGVTLLGTQTIRDIKFFNQNNGNSSGGGGGF